MSTLQSGAGETRPQQIQPQASAYAHPLNQPTLEQVEQANPVKLEYKPVETGKPVHGLMHKISRIQLGVKPIRPKAKGYGYYYVPLDQLMEALVRPFQQLGLAVSSSAKEMPSIGGNFPGMLFTTTLTDLETGETVESTHVIPPLTNPQNLGKWETYLRRYSLISLLGICAETDTDGESSPKQQTYRRQR